METDVSSRFVEVDGMRLHYLESGAGEPVLLLHGWPTSSFLYRNVIGHVAQKNRAIALDLPGFGSSDKPLDASYSFRFYSRVLDGFLSALNVDETSLVVHDLGGPVGLYWACHHPERVRKLVLLNTLVYPNPSPAVVLFVAACRIPGLRALLTGSRGLRTAMRVGVSDPGVLTDETIRAVQAPFQTWDARRALLKAGYGLNPKGFQEIARLLPALRGPVLAAYGEKDRILPDVAKTMRRVARDLPQTELMAIADCGHFLQEERPDQVGQILADFLSR